MGNRTVYYFRDEDMWPGPLPESLWCLYVEYENPAPQHTVEPKASSAGAVIGATCTVLVLAATIWACLF